MNSIFVRSIKRNYNDGGYAPEWLKPKDQGQCSIPTTKWQLVIIYLNAKVQCQRTPPCTLKLTYLSEFYQSYYCLSLAVIHTIYQIKLQFW